MGNSCFRQLCCCLCRKKRHRHSISSTTPLLNNYERWCDPRTLRYQPPGLRRAQGRLSTTIYVPSNSVPQVESTKIDREPWYFGNITRDEAKFCLLLKGNRNGSFLIRKPSSQTYKYSLAVLINDKVKHFYIKKKTSRGGKRRLFITEKVKFEDLQKLIKYYQNQNTDTLGTKLRVPCIKNFFNLAGPTTGLGRSQTSTSISGPFDQTATENDIPTHSMNQLDSDIYREPWYFGFISRNLAKELLLMNDNRNGSFLVRESTSRTDMNTLSVLVNDKVKHFHIQEKICREGKRWFFVSKSMEFQKLSQLIQYYHYNKSDTLGTKLKYPCIREMPPSNLVIPPRKQVRFNLPK